MRLTIARKLINNEFTSAFRKAVLNTSRKDVEPFVVDVKNKLYLKINNLNQFYTRVIGLDEVRLCLERVSILQEKLFQIQEQRREVGRQLSDIRAASNDLQEQLHKTKRQDNIDVFMDLLRRETENVKLEQQVAKTFAQYDQTERELFTAFTNAIRDSHEKQRAQLEYTKYLGFGLSILGGFLAYCYSALKKDDLKVFLDHKMTEMSNNQEISYSKNTSLDNSLIKEIDGLGISVKNLSSDIGVLKSDLSKQNNILSDKNSDITILNEINNINRYFDEMNNNIDALKQSIQEDGTIIIQNNGFDLKTVVIAAVCISVVSKIITGF